MAAIRTVEERKTDLTAAIAIFLAMISRWFWNLGGNEGSGGVPQKLKGGFGLWG